MVLLCTHLLSFLETGNPASSKRPLFVPILLVLLFLAGLFHFSAAPEEPPLKVGFIILGDVNGNGGIDIGDAVSIVNRLVGKPVVNFVEAAADTNKNGGIDIGDAVTIVNILVGRTQSLSRRFECDEKEPQ